MINYPSTNTLSNRFMRGLFGILPEALSSALSGNAEQPAGQKQTGQPSDYTIPVMHTVGTEKAEPTPVGSPKPQPVGGATMVAQIPEGKPPWYFVPRTPHHEYPNPPTLADQLFTRGHLGFADQMQDAMDRMLQVNLANQQASLRNKEIMAPLMAEQIRATALAHALGALGGLGGNGAGKPRFTSNFGQSINFRG